MAKLRLKALGLLLKKFAAIINFKFATKSELDDAIDEVTNNAIVKDVPVTINGEVLEFDATAEAEIDGEMLIIGEE